MSELWLARQYEIGQNHVGTNTGTPHNAWQEQQYEHAATQ